MWAARNEQQRSRLGVISSCRTQLGGRAGAAAQRHHSIGTPRCIWDSWWWTTYRSKPSAQALWCTGTHGSGSALCTHAIRDTDQPPALTDCIRSASVPPVPQGAGPQARVLPVHGVPHGPLAHEHAVQPGRGGAVRRGAARDGLQVSGLRRGGSIRAQCGGFVVFSM